MELNGRSVGALVLVISIALEGDSDVEHATFALFFCSEEIGTVAAAVHLLAGSKTWLHRQLDQSGPDGRFQFSVLVFFGLSHFKMWWTLE
ncbi:MAG: hypothetical protein DME32_15585 [Verrucomicrobia bacterium]|nr:MAG: hypothetical protein DME32_15585 [Verrucomicrobiota bacterium]